MSAERGQRVVVVTGAAGGIGSATVRGLAARGTRVLAVDLDREGAERAAEGARGLAGEVEALAADVSDDDAVCAAVAQARATWGRLDGVFNNAAVLGPVAPIGDYARDDFDLVFRVNVRAVWLGMKHALPALRERGRGNRQHRLERRPPWLAAHVRLRRLEARRDWPDEGAGGRVRQGGDPRERDLPRTN